MKEVISNEVFIFWGQNMGWTLPIDWPTKLAIGWQIESTFIDSSGMHDSSSFFLRS